MKVYSCGHERWFPIQHCIEAPFNRATEWKTVCKKQRTTKRVSDPDLCPDPACFLNNLKWQGWTCCWCSESGNKMDGCVGPPTGGISCEHFICSQCQYSWGMLNPTYVLLQSKCWTDILLSIRWTHVHCIHATVLEWSHRREARFNNSVQEPRQENKMDDVGEDEKTALFAMLKAMLAFRPDGRLTAAEILETEWMRKWALPLLGIV